MFNVCFSGRGRLSELDHWAYILAHFPCDRAYLLGGPDHLETTDRILKTAVRIKTMAELPTSCPLVLFSPANARYIPGKVSLSTFKHPEDATYAFGPNNVHLSEDEMGGRRPDDVVFIPTADHHEFFDFVAAAVALWDRANRHG